MNPQKINTPPSSSTSSTSTLYLELDFLDVTQRKSSAIQQIPVLLQTLQQDKNNSKFEIHCEEGKVVSSQYCLLPADLREIDQVEASFTRAGIDYSVPTFILAECVLVYMHPQQSDALLQWLGQNFSTTAAAMVLYEQVNPDDAFGKQMMINLSVRGCPLLGIMPTLQAHKERLKNAGWGRADAKTMNEIYKGCLDANDVRRIQKLEIFDEFEEWDLIQEHYCIALGVNSSASGNEGGGVLDGFGLKEAKDPRIDALKALLAAKKS